jgi:hypothetical protein
MAEFSRRLLWCAALLLALGLAPARAAGVEIASARIVLSEEAYVLHADFDFALNQKLMDALTHGVALYFVTELRIERPRWYWFNKTVAHRRLEYRLAYHALTRSYRLNIGSLHRSFDRLEDALHTMRHIRNLYVASPDAFNAGVSYRAELRFFHDTSQLPKPFQLSALGSGDWGIDTKWRNWSFLPETVIPE